MPDFSLLEATRAVEKTMPFVLYRLFIATAISTAFLLAALVSAGTGYGIGSIGENPGFVSVFLAICGLALCGLFVYSSRASFLYSVKMPHLALLVEYYQDHSLPSGFEQINHGKKIVSKRFKDRTTLVTTTALIRRVIRFFFRDRYGLQRVFSLSTTGSPGKYVNTIAAILFAFTDSTILGYRFRNETENNWKATHDGLIYFALDFKRLAKNVLILKLFSYLLTLTFFFLLLMPISVVTANIPIPVTEWGYVFALLFALSLKSAFLDPLIDAAMFQVFVKSTDSKSVDDELVNQLAEESQDFKSIRNRATNALRETIEETINDPTG